jgi:hypothetical protein
MKETYATHALPFRNTPDIIVNVKREERPGLAARARRNQVVKRDGRGKNNILLDVHEL